MKRFLVLAVVFLSGAAAAQTPGEPRYDMGSPAISWTWVDPRTGSDSAAGTEGSPLRTLTEAWNRIPARTPLTGAGRGIALRPGDYPAAAVPGWMESRWGTAEAPVLIQAVGGPARLHGYLDISDCRYLYLIDIAVVTDPDQPGGGNALHLASCDHVLLRGCALDGFDGTERRTQETLKVNQCRHVYVEGCDIAGAFWYPLDFVAVQYGHIVDSRIHDGGEWCVLVKGGSAYLLIEGNEIYNGDTGGFVAGNGTGFEFMVSPWIHYEVEHIKFVNNLIHHTGTAGMGVNGGYNVLLAYNTLYKAGTRDHVIEVVQGRRGCDGNTARCSALNAEGGWGDAGPQGEYIPCRNVYVYNNLVYNPPGWASRWKHFTVAGPVLPPAGSNVPSPSVADAGLRIAGNLIWNGGLDLALGLGEEGQGGRDDNPTCNRTLVRAENIFNGPEPPLLDPENGDYGVRPGASLGLAMKAIPPFPGDDRPQRPLAPQGNLDNTVARIDLPFSGSRGTAISLAQALNRTDWTWSAGGDAPWFGQDAVSRDGSAAQSGAMGIGGESWLETAVEGPGFLVYWGKVSANAADGLEFLVDGRPRGRIAGEQDWRPGFAALGAGAHFLRWRFNRSGTGGANAAWLDQVVWRPLLR